MEQRDERLKGLMLRMGGDPIDTELAFAAGRYDAPKPADWDDRCDAILALWEPVQREVLDALGWDSPAPVSDVWDRLHEYRVGRGDESFFTLEVPSDDGGVPFHLPKDNATRLLRDRTRTLSRDLGVEEWRAVAFLLANVRELPWISVSWQWCATGFRFALEVGSGDAQAEDVRTAYMAAREIAHGTRRHHTRPSTSIRQAIHDLRGRARGLSWRQRWKAWSEWALEHGATAFLPKPATDPAEAVKSERNAINAYRVTVDRIVKETAWLKRIEDELRKRGGDEE